MKKKNHPNHISFIMDGNNRWSKINSKNKFYSYKKGATHLIELSKYIFKNYNTDYVSAFGLSTHNLKRSKNFIKTITKVFESLLNDMNAFNIDYKVKFIGDLSFLNIKNLKKINEIELLNLKSSKTLLIFINYSGQLEIINTILKSSNAKDFQKNLLTYPYPDPDLLIRTGGFQRISDFMLYQLTFTELIFLKKLWPDLKKKDIQKIIKNYISIERKFGI